MIFPQEESPLRLGCIMFFFNFCRVFVFLLLGGCAFIGSINSEPFYNYAYCADPSNGTSNASYESDLRVLLRSLSTKENYSFYNDSFNGIYGLFLCRGDVNSSTCQSCISYASQDITNRCSSNRTGIIWFDECLLRYSATNFFGQPQMLPYILMWNVNNQTSPDLPNYGARGLINKLIGEALAKETFFSVGNATSPGNPSELIYGLVQCTLDLNSSSCSACLNKLLENAEACCQEKKGLRILAPSCSIRYENYSFFQQSPSEPVPVPPQQVPAAPPPPPGQGKGKNTTLIVSITVASIAVVATLLGLWYYSFSGRRKIREWEKSQEILLQNLDTSSPPRFAGTSFHARDQENSGEMHYFSLSTIQTATNNFSDENKLGEGGFGPVYKGKLINGKEIAIKRLSMNSQQGLEEFKNEVMVIAKLQHRNLVRLLGYCLEEDEKLLVYEYMANTSLDVFLFDQTKRQLLDWARRTNIINGIAKGLLYLHEDSRLKIIHRDLKSSNILLDNEMNPKISDFGTARIFDSNQIKANTNRVVGTYGYMAPEYAMEGLFSIKSDVYSFGVLMLEILSGKKNTGFYNSERAQSLLSLAWQLWNEGRGLELIDETLVHTCLEGEALRLIHIALSCVQEDPNDRPTMSLVVLMLGGNSIDLPQPLAPPFSVGRSTLTGLSSDTGTRTGFTSGLSSTSASAHSRD